MYAALFSFENRNPAPANATALKSPLTTSVVIYYLLISVGISFLSLWYFNPIMLTATPTASFKTHMYDFFYDYIKPMYDENLKLLMTDTDSLVLEINVKNVKDRDDALKLFDFNNYPVTVQ